MPTDEPGRPSISRGVGFDATENGALWPVTVGSVYAVKEDGTEALRARIAELEEALRQATGETRRLRDVSTRQCEENVRLRTENIRLVKMAAEIVRKAEAVASEHEGLLLRLLMRGHGDRPQ